MTTERIAGLYTKVRTGKFFLIFLALFCGIWIGWNELTFLPKFDDSAFGRLTLILSVEASLATSMLIMANEKQETFQHQQLLYIQHLMEAQNDTLKIMRVYLEQSLNDGTVGDIESSADTKKSASMVRCDAR